MPVAAKGVGVLKFASKRIKNSLIRKGKKLAATQPAPPLPKGVYDRVAQAKSEYFTVGFAKTDVMPPDIPKKRYYIAGYSSYNPAKRVLDPMTASAVWIDDNSGHGCIALASFDSVGLTDYDVNIIRAGLSDFVQKTGCRGIHVLSPHNHAGIDTIGMWGFLPKSGRNKKYMKLVQDSIQRVIREAYEDRREGSIYYGKKESPEIQRDSRLPHVYSKDLTRLRFVPNDGSREVWMLNYASHTESMLGNDVLSADFACYMRRGIMEMAGAESIYFVGAIGGLIRLKELDPDFIESTKIGGKALADTAVAITDEVKLEPKISTLRQEYYSPVDNFLLAFLGKVGILKKDWYGNGEGDLGLSIKTEMTYIQIGSLNMLLLPSEIFPELCYGGYLPAEESAEGKSPDINPEPLVDIAGDKNLLIFGVANDFTGYVVPPNDFLLNPDVPYVNTTKDRLGRGHYEETNSLGIQTAQRIADTFRGMMETVRQAEAAQ